MSVCVAPITIISFLHYRIPNQRHCYSFLHFHKKSASLRVNLFIVYQEIYCLADKIGLKVPDIDMFVDNLNSVGYLLKKGPKTYQVSS